MAGFTNKSRAIARMRKLGPAVRKAARAQLRANAEELVQTQRGFAPEQDGDLKDSIRTFESSDVTRISYTIKAGGQVAYYAPFVEFGHGNAQPRPFFWPAYRLKKRRFKLRMNKAAKLAIQGAISQ